MHKRIRAPGAGRKPQGPLINKSSTLTTRVLDSTRRFLEEEAAKAGRSLSQEVELRLRATMGKRVAVHIETALEPPESDKGD